MTIDTVVNNVGTLPKSRQKMFEVDQEVIDVYDKFVDSVDHEELEDREDKHSDAHIHATNSLKGKRAYHEEDGLDILADAIIEYRLKSMTKPEHEASMRAHYKENRHQIISEIEQKLESNKEIENPNNLLKNSKGRKQLLDILIEGDQQEDIQGYISESIKPHVPKKWKFENYNQFAKLIANLDNTKDYTKGDLAGMSSRGAVKQGLAKVYVQEISRQKRKQEYKAAVNPSSN